MFDRIHDSLSLYDMATASPISNPEAYAVVAEIEEEEYARRHCPPASCEYCEHYCMRTCTITMERHPIGACKHYEWNGEPEDEYDRYRRLHPEVEF